MIQYECNESKGLERMVFRQTGEEGQGDVSGLSVLVSGSREDVPHNFGSHTIPLLS